MSMNLRFALILAPVVLGSFALSGCGGGAAPKLSFPGLRLPVGEEPTSVAIGDLDGDGFLDLVTANWGSDDVSVLLGAGDGTFGAAATFAAGHFPRSVAIDDLDGDGFLDLVTANSDSNDVSVLLGAGDGTFGAAATFTAGYGAYSVAIDDLDGDGFLDLVTANAASNDVSVLINQR